ncbi:MAG: gliding motility-associated C-terminal domain-containing protein [Bacteroidales bacterium]|nr:gliding motility-associated C-terminal domain-containing protein [Bacteroidales bacterium]
MKKLILHILLQFAVMIGFGQVFHVGDLYTAPDGSQGVVFFVRADGSGWAVALHDLSYMIPWSTTSDDIPSLPNYSSTFVQASLADTSGYTNTQQIRNFYGPGYHYAAGAVDFEHGWYLPATGQLAMIYAQLSLLQTALVNAGGNPIVTEGPSSDFFGFPYWSSSEVSAQHAVKFSFADDGAYGFFSSLTGSPQILDKQLQLLVRAVRSFPPPQNVYDTTLSYQWNTGSTEPHFHDVPLQSMTYVVTVSNEHGCTNTDSADVMVIDNNPQVIYDTVCQGSTYINNGFTLSAQETAEVGEIVRTHTVSAADCESEITLFLTVMPHDTVHIEQTAHQSFVWNDVTYNESGTYTQHFNNHMDCDSTVILTLTLDGGDDPGPEPDTIPFGENDSLFLYLPNAITPSRIDGINDYFYLPEAYHPFINEFEISIFNRWGVQVFHASDKHFRWDGTINGKIYYSAVYNYIIRFYDIIGRPYYLKGSFTVL